MSVSQCTKSVGPSKPSFKTNTKDKRQRDKTQKKVVQEVIKSISNPQKTKNTKIETTENKRDKTSPKFNDCVEVKGKNKSTAKQDIDDIFAKKANKPTTKDSDNLGNVQKTKNKNDTKVEDVDDKEFWKDSRGDKNTKRKMVDGLAVYTYEELGIRADSGGNKAVVSTQSTGVG
eukprot:TRINITY_DN12690_c0_g1_i1.p1 TRINITY_DN12690_c0_g1~~TRINITY_DN12690_c0_g1_i1.p1  ORF type:complete len:174 (+),score=44.98 TRINITY_DN12690_c0_g1_i1:468-989(+)